MDNLQKAKNMVDDFHQEYKSGHPMFTDDDIFLLKWMVTQSELGNFHSKKLGELNLFLQERKVGHVGGNVIDIAMDYIRYLEKENGMKV